MLIPSTGPNIIGSDRRPEQLRPTDSGSGGGGDGGVELDAASEFGEALDQPTLHEVARRVLDQDCVAATATATHPPQVAQTVMAPWHPASPLEPGRGYGEATARCCA